MRGLARSLVCVLALGSASADDAGRPVLLAIDAEFGVVASTSAQAIQRGAEAAAAEINAAGGVLDGRPLKVVVRNNNSMPARAEENLRELADDPDVVAVMAGKHSPVVRRLLPIIHDLGIPYLVPWAAADQLTEHGHVPNFVFRLSLRDSWAIAAMVREATRRGYSRFALLLPNSGWGRSCRDAAEKLLDGRKGPQLVAQQWYNFGDEEFRTQYDTILAARADVLILVANELEGAAAVVEIGRRPKAERLPVYSHWGVSGGKFFDRAKQALTVVDFSVVQTYSFLDARGARARGVIDFLRRRDGIAGAREIASPVGVAHAYDLTHLLARAVRQAGTIERRQVRDALERLAEYDGLVRRYQAPFTATRHDALGPAQVFLARYAPDGAIVRAR